MKKTIKGWEKEFGVTILDLDGFDRTDLDLHKKIVHQRRVSKGNDEKHYSNRRQVKILGKEMKE